MFVVEKDPPQFASLVVVCGTNFSYSLKFAESPLVELYVYHTTTIEHAVAGSA
jgi:hypothetical protein